MFTIIHKLFIPLLKFNITLRCTLTCQLIKGYLSSQTCHNMSKTWFMQIILVKGGNLIWFIQSGPSPPSCIILIFIQFSLCSLYFIYLLFPSFRISFLFLSPPIRQKDGQTFICLCTYQMSNRFHRERVVQRCSAFSTMNHNNTITGSFTFMIGYLLIIHKCY